MTNNDILMVASLDRIRALNDVAEAGDAMQRRAACIAAQALLALRDTVKRPSYPAVYATRMKNIRRTLPRLGGQT